MRAIDRVRNEKTKVRESGSYKQHYELHIQISEITARCSAIASRKSQRRDV